MLSTSYGPYCLIFMTIKQGYNYNCHIIAKESEAKKSILKTEHSNLHSWDQNSGNMTLVPTFLT